MDEFYADQSTVANCRTCDTYVFLAVILQTPIQYTFV